MKEEYYESRSKSSQIRISNNSTVTTYYQGSYADCTSKPYTADIEKEMFTNKTENDKLTVYYNPDNPEELRPDMSHEIFAVIIFGLMLIGIIYFSQIYIDYD